jgi:hypothetical protein
VAAAEPTIVQSALAHRNGGREICTKSHSTIIHFRSSGRTLVNTTACGKPDSGSPVNFRICDSLPMLSVGLSPANLERSSGGIS